MAFSHVTNTPTSFKVKYWSFYRKSGKGPLQNFFFSIFWRLNDRWMKIPFCWNGTQKPFHHFFGTFFDRIVFLIFLSFCNNKSFLRSEGLLLPSLHWRRREQQQRKKVFAWILMRVHPHLAVWGIRPRIST